MYRILIAWQVVGLVGLSTLVAINILMVWLGWDSRRWPAAERDALLMVWLAWRW